MPDSDSQPLITKFMSKFFRSKRAKRTFIRRGIALLALVFILCGFWAWRMVLASNFDIKETTYVYVDSKKDFNDLCSQLKDSASCKSLTTFKQLAYLIGYLFFATICNSSKKYVGWLWSGHNEKYYRRGQ